MQVEGRRRLRSARAGWSTLAAWALALAVLPAAPAAARQLSWRPLAVEARLEADGGLTVRESHTMVFTGDWNGGERIFDLRAGQSLELLSLSRIDPQSGAVTPLVEGSLSRVDHYDWTDRQTLRWRSRLPTDPPFEQTPITYLIEYRQEGVLRALGELYRLDHDFAFPQRSWPIEAFTLELEIDPIWRPTARLPGSWGPVDLGYSESFVVTVDLEYTGEGAPAAVWHLPSPALRAALFLGAALAILWLLIDFWRREAALGRFSPPPAPPAIDTGWLEEHLFQLLPEEAGALWDRRVAAPEVAAILARWQGEGKIESEVVARPGLFKKDLLKLRLTAERGEFEGYDAALMGKLFFGGRQEVDTDEIRKQYRKTGFDPAGAVRPGIERRLRRRGKEIEVHKPLPGKRGRLTLGLFLAAVALFAVEAIGRPLLTFQLAMLLVVPAAFVYVGCGLVFATVYRVRVTRLLAWSVGFLAPGLILFALLAILAFFDRIAPGSDFPLQPGIFGTAALAVLAVMFWSSLLNNARCRERPAGLAARQRLAAARRLFAVELERQQPGLFDEWMPYLLALGLGPRVDRWWRRFGAAVEAAPVGRRLDPGRPTAGGSSWTGGGGAFGGAGASASWAAVAGSVAAGVAKPGSGGSGGGGGGGGSSGGGGGGGW